jgi:hypothetical protein
MLSSLSAVRSVENNVSLDESLVDTDESLVDKLTASGIYIPETN